ncbi:MAG: hypothetical protein ACI8X3_001955, partial [Saprospiraceae bacterium]
SQTDNNKIYNDKNRPGFDCNFRAILFLENTFQTAKINQRILKS